jgi:hypothetical protein
MVLVSDPVYRSSVLFCVGDGKALWSRVEKKYGKLPIENNFDDCRGSCWELKDAKGHPLWVVWVGAKTDWKAMVHEASHLTFYILDARGVQYSSEDDEAWCYLHEFWIERLWDEMLKVK